MQSIPPPALPIRLWAAAMRMERFIRLLPRVDVALIFAADGWSVMEKGLMCIIARLSRKGVVLRISSGHIIDQCKQRWLIRFWLKQTLRSAHVVCSQGPFWTGFFSQFGQARGKLVEVPNPITISEQVNRNGAGRSVPPRISFVGQVVRQKGIFELLPVLKKVRESFPSARLSVAGSGGDLRAFKEAAEGAELSDCVEHLGWIKQPQVNDLLRNTDVFVLPSHSEGMPNAVLEAMAAGVPCVVTRVGALPDLIRNGENGYITEVGGVSAMSAAIIELLSDSSHAARIGAAGRQSVAGYELRRVWPIYAKVLCRAAYEANRRSTVLYEAPEV